MRQYQRLLTISLLIGLCIAINYVRRMHLTSTIPGVDLTDYYKLIANQKRENVQCHLPQLNPYDASILPYIRPPPKQLHCKRLQANVVYFKEGNMHLNFTEVDLEHLKSEYLTCRYRCLGLTEYEDNAIYGDWIMTNFTRSSDSIAVHCATVHVQCYSGRLSLIPAYDYIHLHIPKLSSKSFDTTDKPNVVILVLDSVSRSNFLRQLPNSYMYLTQNLSAIDFRGMLKIGENSFPNLVGFLTGRVPRSKELPNERGPFDNWPLIFYNFSRDGYVTLYNEDKPEYSTFNYYTYGFRKQPTTHYARGYWVALWNTLVHYGSTQYCYGNFAKHVLQWHHVQSLWEATSAPKFAMSVTNEISHDDLNAVGAADLDLLNFFIKLEPYLNNTFLFVLGDHGLRFGAIRETLVGRYEERMGFYSIVVPHWFRDRYKATLLNNLHDNSNKLVSLYDFHATLAEILHRTFGKSSYITTQEHSFHGMSLFRHIPANRTCNEAFIPSDLCVCQREIPMPLNDTQVIRAAHALAHQINLVYIKPYQKHCANLILDQVKSAQLSLPEHDVVEDVGGRYGGKSVGKIALEFVLIVQFKPSQALFEAKVLYHVQDNNHEIAGDINRINRYGNQSHCIPDGQSKKFCYCIDLL